jgi:hypothetical protein
VSVYGPCKGIQRDNFAHWLYNLHILVQSNWLLIGDFNFIRIFANRNKPGGDINDMFLFNEIIGHMELLEFPSKVESILGQICKISPSLSNWIGSSQVLIGFLYIQIPLSYLYPTLNQIMFPV